MFRKLIFICLVLMVSLLAACASAETTTVMVYMCGSNLHELSSSTATAEVQEMLASGLDASQTRVYIMANGNLQIAAADTNGGQGCVYALEGKRHGDQAKLTVLQQGLSGMNMGEQTTLIWFLNYCAENSQTDRYALILWDYGNDSMSLFSGSEAYDREFLTLEQLTAALAASPFVEKKLSWIGFDGSKMSTVEIAIKMAPYAECMIASQADELSAGWDYAFLKGLENDQSPMETAKRIMDAYFGVSDKTSADMQMSCVDLSKASEIEASMDAVFSALAEKLTEETFSGFDTFRNDAKIFGELYYDRVSFSGYVPVDILSLAECFASQFPVDIGQIREAVGNAVVYSRSNATGACGLSVYHPYRAGSRFDEWEIAYEQLNFCPGYTAFVKSFGQIMKDRSVNTASEN